MLIPQEELEVLYDVDVVVIGGGASGVCAAVTASRNGAKTLLVEQRGFAGGTGAFTAIPAFCPYTDGVNIVSQGIAYEILQKVKEQSNDECQAMNKEKLDWVTIDTETYKRVCDELLIESKVEVLFHTVCSQVLYDGSKIQGLVISNKNGRSVIKGKVYIDASGDADIAYMSGVPVLKGDKDDSTVQPGTMCFVVAGIDYDKCMQYSGTQEDTQFAELVKEAQRKGDIPKGRERVSSYSWVSKSIASFNFGHVFGVDGTDAKSLTKANIEGRKLVKIYVNFLRKYVPGFEKANLVYSGEQVGIRESRRIEADYMMSVDDFKQMRSFTDEIARNSYFIDVHLPNQNSTMVMEYLPKGKSHGIPYRCMLPRGKDNLLVVGRTIGSDRLINSALRVMPNCFTMGQAAVTAAYLASREEIGYRDIKIEELQKLLVEQGAKIDLIKNKV
ncbi:MAG: FAD-dependent oxidoreductase [Coprobacillaceae bacterium]